MFYTRSSRPLRYVQWNHVPVRPEAVMIAKSPSINDDDDDDKN
jgi:hypothetical protein